MNTKYILLIMLLAVISPKVSAQFYTYDKRELETESPSAAHYNDNMNYEYSETFAGKEYTSVLKAGSFDPNEDDATIGGRELPVSDGLYAVMFLSFIYLFHLKRKNEIRNKNRN